jgi:hypothetical protein
MGSGFPRRVHAGAHDWRQVLTFQGKSCLVFGAFVHFEISWEKFRTFHGRFGLFGVVIRCRAGPRNVQISSHEVSKFTPGKENLPLQHTIYCMLGLT